MKQIIPSITSQFIQGCSETKNNHLLCLPEQPSFTDLFYKALFESVQNDRLEQIRNRLAEMGYQFRDKNLMIEFLRGNATIITFPDKPDYREMYLFYGTKDQATVGSWWETMRFEHNFNDAEYGHKVAVIAGEPR